MQLWDGYLDRAELGIVEATIPRLLLYLSQQLTEVSSPRQYLGCGRTSGRPYSPVRSQEGAEFLHSKSEWIVESVRTIFFNTLLSANSLSMVPIVCSSSASPNRGARLPDLYAYSPCRIVYVCEQTTPKKRSPQP